MSKSLRSRLARVAAGTLLAACFAAPALADRDWNDHRWREHRHDRSCHHGDRDRYDREYYGGSREYYGGPRYGSRSWVPGYAQGYRGAPYYYAQRAEYRCPCGKHFRKRNDFARHLYRHHPNAYYAWFQR